jgi:protein SCO1/2
MKIILLPVFLLCSSGVRADGNQGHPTPSAIRDVPDGSLYALESVWTTQDGAKVEWNKSQGTARVLAMGYSTCQGICPRIIADMQRIESKLSPEERGKVTFTFLSVAPETDGVPELKALADNHKLNGKTWQVMRSDADSVLEMAVALGIQFTLLPNGVDYAHSYLIAVISPEGRTVCKWTDPSKGPEESIAAIKSFFPGDKE